MSRKIIDKEQMMYMVRNDKKSQQTHLVATMVAVMPNNVEFTDSGVAYPTALIPKNSVIGTVTAVVTEAFPAGATFDVGIAGDPKCFFDAVSGAAVTATASNAGTIAGMKYYPEDTDIIITPTYEGENIKGEVSFVFELFELEASIGRHTR